MKKFALVHGNDWCWFHIRLIYYLEYKTVFTTESLRLNSHESVLTFLRLFIMILLTIAD